MKLWNALRNFIRPAPPPSSLRNKVGGLAWIKLPRDEGNGSYILHRRVVKTASLESSGYWRIEPWQEFVALGLVLGRNAAALPGNNVIVTSIHDDLLEPIRDVGEGERSQELAWLPPVPQAGKVPA